MASLQINLDRIQQHFAELATINAGTEGYTRLAYSQEEKQAIAWLKEKLISLQIPVRQDAVGNLFARLGDPTKPAILIGSHLDTVPAGGLYDGALGVLTALECLAVLHEANFTPDIPIELVVFVGEEANPLGGTFGSRALAGLISSTEELLPKLAEHGYEWADVIDARCESADYVQYLELHIEQGSVLETNQKQIGVVTAIAGIYRMLVQVTGRASHSGTTPMSLRKDALVDASKLVQHVYQAALANQTELVATVGEISISPNLANVVPGEAELLIEIRGADWDQMLQFAQSVQNWADHEINAQFTPVVEKKPHQLNQQIRQTIRRACEQLEVSYQDIFSGANHDANSLATFTDVGMIFVPSKDGVSHHPDEFTSWDEIAIGAQVTLQTLQQLAKGG